MTYSIPKKFRNTSAADLKALALAISQSILTVASADDITEVLVSQNARSAIVAKYPDFIHKDITELCNYIASGTPAVKFIFNQENGVELLATYITDILGTFRDHRDGDLPDANTFYTTEGTVAEVAIATQVDEDTAENPDQSAEAITTPVPVAPAVVVIDAGSEPIVIDAPARVAAAITAIVTSPAETDPAEAQAAAAAVVSTTAIDTDPEAAKIATDAIAAVIQAESLTDAAAVDNVAAALVAVINNAATADTEEHLVSKVLESVAVAPSVEDPAAATQAALVLGKVMNAAAPTTNVPGYFIADALQSDDSVVNNFPVERIAEPEDALTAAPVFEITPVTSVVEAITNAAISNPMGNLDYATQQATAIVDAMSIQGITSDPSAISAVTALLQSPPVSDPAAIQNVVAATMAVVAPVVSSNDPEPSVLKNILSSVADAPAVTDQAAAAGAVTVLCNIANAADNAAFFGIPTMIQLSQALQSTTAVAPPPAEPTAAEKLFQTAFGNTPVTDGPKYSIGVNHILAIVREHMRELSKHHHHNGHTGGHRQVMFWEALLSMFNVISYDDFVIVYPLVLQEIGKHIDDAMSEHRSLLYITEMRVSDANKNAFIRLVTFLRLAALAQTDMSVLRQTSIRSITNFPCYTEQGRSRLNEYYQHFN